MSRTGRAAGKRARAGGARPSRVAGARPPGNRAGRLVVPQSDDVTGSAPCVTAVRYAAWLGASAAGGARGRTTHIRRGQGVSGHESARCGNAATRGRSCQRRDSPGKASEHPDFKSPQCYYSGDRAGIVALVVTAGIEIWTEDRYNAEIKDAEPIDGFHTITVASNIDRRTCWRWWMSRMVSS